MGIYTRHNGAWHEVKPPVEPAFSLPDVTAEGEVLTTTTDSYGWAPLAAYTKEESDAKYATEEYVNNNAVVGNGKVLQVVHQSGNQTIASTNNTDYEDVADMSITITPTQVTSKIMLMFNGAVDLASTNDYMVSRFRIVKDGVLVEGGEGQYGISNLTGTGGRGHWAHTAITAYDSPNTTSAVTYTLQFKSNQSQVTTKWNGGTSAGQMFAIEVAA
jgi:hypothetical protein